MSLIDTWFDVYAHAQVAPALRSAVALLLMLGALALALVVPPAAMALADLLARSGGPWLTGAAVAGWLATPVAAATLLGACVTSVVAGYLALAGVTHIAAGAGRGATPRAVDALATALAALPRLLRLALGQVPMIGGAVVLLAVALTGALLAGTDRDAAAPGLAALPAPLWWSIAALLLPALIRLASDAVLAVPVCLYERRCGRAGRARRRALLAGQRWRAAWLLLLNLGLWALAAAALIAVAWFATPRVLSDTPPGPGLVLLTATVLAGWTLLALALAALFVVAAALPGIHLYLALQQRDGLPQRLWQDTAVAVPLADPWAGLLVGLALLGLLAAAGHLGRLASEELGLAREVLVAAHRGGAGAAPENTLAALWQARSDGADLATIDVQATADDVVVLLHDPDLRRVAGIGRKVWEADYEDLRLVDVGRWFGDAFANEPVPTLAEALVVSERRLALDIVLRDYGHSRHLPAAVADLVRASHCASRCSLSADDPQALTRLRMLAPDLPLGLIRRSPYRDPAALNAALPAPLRGEAAPALAHLYLERGAVDRALLAANRDARLRTHVGVVNDPTEMARLIDWGVDVIVTDHPARLHRLLGVRAAMSDRERLLLAIGRTLQRSR